jgi:hypothetical protein
VISDNLDCIPNLYISTLEVQSLLEGLKLNKSAGADGVHADIIKPISGIVSHAVCELFNLSLAEGNIPADWREATVVAIHKGGKRGSASSYRPVSLTSVLCKSMERLIRKHMCTYFVSNKLLSRTQHNFLQGRSCLTNLICFLDEITKRLEEGKKVEVCYLDFNKAFDSVSHRLLIDKLKGKGITHQLTYWVTSFLKDRTFKVRVGDALSEKENAISGVPQGSVLGPLLFLIFIDDLVKDLANPCFVFADDVKVVSSNNRESLVEDLQKVLSWSEKWDLPLNISKCHVFTDRKLSLIHI